MKILALLDGRPGNDNQTLAIAEKLGDFTPLKISFTTFARFPNSILRNSLIGVKTEIPKSPDIIISTGRKLARISRYIKSKNSSCKVFHMMWPGHGFENFDIIFVPEHDKRTAANIIQTKGSPTRFLHSQSSGLLPTYENEKIGALLGGINSEEAKNLCDILNNIDASYYITSSRRTHSETQASLKLHLKKEYYFYDWRSGEENPYSSILAQSDKLIVTGDSVGMISEACATGKPVYIYGEAAKPKFKAFHKSLYEGKHAKPLSDSNLEGFRPKILDTTNFIVNEIQKALKA